MKLLVGAPIMLVAKAGHLKGWIIIDLCIRAITENLIGIIAASIPILKPLHIRTLESHPLSRSQKGSSKVYLAASDGEPIGQGQKKHVAPDPCSTAEKDDNTSRGIFDRKGGSKMEFHTNIELDRNSEQRPIVSAV